MIPKTALVTGPVRKPVDLISAKDQVRVDYEFEDDDSYIERLIGSATELVENITGRKLITQKWNVFFDHWPEVDHFEIPFGKLQTVHSITYVESDNSLTTWNSNSYIVDSWSDPGKVVLAYAQQWPSVTLKPVNAICIQITCGYGSDEILVPEDLRHAIKLLLTHWYENRETVVVGTITGKIPKTVDSIVDHYKIWNYHHV